MARKLQEEADEEGALAMAANQEARPKKTERMTVQVPADKAAGSELNVKTPSGHMVKVKVPAGTGPGDSFVVEAYPAPDDVRTPAKKDVENLLDLNVSEMHEESVWAARLQRFSTKGVSCHKVGRNGQKYKRTFWLGRGLLVTNGLGAASVDLHALIGAYRGCHSSEFETLLAEPESKKKARSSLLPGAVGSLWKTGKKYADLDSLPDPEVCCVLTLPQRTFSLIFASSAVRDEFALTVVWYVQQLQSGRANLPGEKVNRF